MPVADDPKSLAEGKERPLTSEAATLRPAVPLTSPETLPTLYRHGEANASTADTVKLPIITASHTPRRASGRTVA